MTAQPVEISWEQQDRAALLQALLAERFPTVQEVERERHQPIPPAGRIPLTYLQLLLYRTTGQIPQSALLP